MRTKRQCGNMPMKRNWIFHCGWHF